MMYRPIRSGDEYHPAFCRCAKCDPPGPSNRRDFTITDAGWIGLAAFALVIVIDLANGAHGLRALFGL
ncbi:MAG: hypothetical protein V4475_01780 [Pseudomonadota bacterium]